MRQFLRSVLDKLDDQQREAAWHDIGNPDHGQVTVLAGPGAGKTRVIVCRMAVLLEGGFKPGEVLCVTFSALAAEEMRRRIRELTGIPEFQLRASVCTFHSLALQIIRTQRGQPLILEQHQARKVLRELLPKDCPYSAVDLLRRFGEYRRKLQAPSDVFDTTSLQDEEWWIADLYQTYDQKLIELNVVDFDTMVYRAVEILQNDPLAEAEWCAKFRHVIVDETHDVSQDQAVLATFLSNHHGQLFVVGDPSQSIYGFRGSSNDLLLSEEAKKTYVLGANYRSGKKIIDAFKLFADDTLLTNNMFAISKDPGCVLLNGGFLDEAEEANYICQEMKEIVSGKVIHHQTTLTSTLPNQLAVLSRTRALLAPFADKLTELGIPYRWIGQNFWQSADVQNLLAFMKFLVNPRDAEAFRRMILSGAQLTKYLGVKFVEKAVKAFSEYKPDSFLYLYPQDIGCDRRQTQTWEEARQELGPLMERGVSSSPSDFLFQVIHTASLGAVLNDPTNPDDFKQENFTQLARRATKFSDHKAFLEHARLMAAAISRSSGVTLSTIHGAKGLEWKNVYLIGVRAGTFPHVLAEDPNEERRLMYVALSRAKSRLFISWQTADGPYEQKYCESEFLTTLKASRSVHQ